MVCEKNLMGKWKLFITATICAVLFGVSGNVYAETQDEQDGQAGREALAAEYYELYAEHDGEVSIERNSPRNANHVKKCGIDVSKWNGRIDWQAVKNSGVSFAFIRVGYRGADGNLYEDPRFKENIAGATAVGIQVGVYFYTEAINDQEAFEEADFAVSRISGYNVELPIMIDYEFCSGDRADTCRLRASNADKATRTQVCKAFAYRCQMWGYQGGVYASKNTFIDTLDGEDIAREYKIWVAQYPYADAESKLLHEDYAWWINTSYQGVYDFWQFSSRGTVVAGIESGHVDMNYWYDDGTMQHINSAKIYALKQTKQQIIYGLTVDATAATVFEYRWLGYSAVSGEWFVLQDWTQNNEWLVWNMDRYGDLMVVGQVRIPSQRDKVFQDVRVLNASPHIKGICQIPNKGPEYGFLIGMETYDNPGQKYTYELQIYDCTAQTWVYSTGRTGVSSGNSFWTVWTPRYGYYWTLYRVYDESGNVIDEQCYGFQNI